VVAALNQIVQSLIIRWKKHGIKLNQLKFENLLNNNWKTLKNKKCDLSEELQNILTPDSILHIGTDAQKNGSKSACDYVTCAIIHDPLNKCTRIFHIKFINIKTSSLWNKLFNETMLSLQLASELTEANIAPQDIILVHVDANPNTKYKSSTHVKSLAGMCLGYGFKHVLKPDSWCSSHAADHLVKGKNKR